MKKWFRRRYGAKPDTRQAAHECGRIGDAPDEARRLPVLFPRLQHRRGRDEDPRGPDGDYGGAQVPGNRGPGRISAWLWGAHADRVHLENDPQGKGHELAKAYAAGTGGHRAGVLESSFIAEVKSDLMGEQTILCGMLQTGSLLCFDRMVELGIDPAYAAKLVQYGWETVTEGLKQGGITNMMDRLSNPAKIRAFDLAEEMKQVLRPLFEKHQDDIMSGHFSAR